MPAMLREGEAGDARGLCTAVRPSVCLSVPLICGSRVENLIAHMFVGPGRPDAPPRRETTTTPLILKIPKARFDLGS